MSGEKEPCWVALESNPELLTKFAELLGASTEEVVFGDCFGLDEELLAFVPKPVHALIFLYPSGDFEAAKEAQEAELKEKGQAISEKLWYTKQLVQNACGSIAVTHALSNAGLSFKEGSFFSKFMEKTKDMNPQV